MIALGGPKLKLLLKDLDADALGVSMIALGGPKLKHIKCWTLEKARQSFNDSTGWA